MRRRTQGSMLAIIATYLVVHAVCAQPTGPPTIGGFDVLRGGRISLAEGDLTQRLREELLCAFPNTVLSGAPELTTSYLQTLDVLILASTFDPGSATVPLSSSEQNALLQYVLAGGTAIIFVDNDSFAGQPTSSIANQSLISPFGMHVTGTVAQFPAPVRVSAPKASRVTNGSFGMIESFNMYPGGWFDVVGPQARSLAVLATTAHQDECVLAVIPRGTLGPSSGTVVLWADASIVFNQFFFDVNRRLINNAIELSPRLCYPDCDTSTGVGVLDIFDFLCFQNAFVTGECYADCDTSSGPGALDIFDFLCFQSAFVAGCP